MYFEILGPVDAIETVAVGRSIRDLRRLRRRYGGRHWRKLKGVATEVPGLKYAICIENDGAEDLEVLKVYRVLPDKAAAAEGHVRVIDESGEDYLYPEGFFVLIDLPAKATRMVSTAGRRSSVRARRT